MHPANVPALTALRPDACALANNHSSISATRDRPTRSRPWPGAGVLGVGAGADLTAARRPAVGGAHDERRVVVGAVAMKSTGVPASWAASHARPGVWLVRDPSLRDAAEEVAAEVSAHKHTGDVAIVSAHCGSNCGYMG